MTPIDARCLWLGALATLLTGTVIAEAPPPPSRPIVLRAAHLFDAVSGKLSNEAVIVIEGGKIKSVGRAAAVPADAQVIDLGDATLLPGFIDAHVHLEDQGGPQLVPRLLPQHHALPGRAGPLRVALREGDPRGRLHHGARRRLAATTWRRACATRSPPA